MNDCRLTAEFSLRHAPLIPAHQSKSSKNQISHNRTPHYQCLIGTNHSAEGFEKRTEILVTQTTKGTKVGKTANI